MPRKKKRGSGQGSVWIQGGNTWIRWRQNGRRRTRKFPGCDAEVRKTAERALAVALLDLAAGRAGLEVERPPSPPLSKLWIDIIARREGTHRAWRDDASRWKVHLGPFLGHVLPDEVTPAEVRRFVEVKIAAGLSTTTAGHCVRLLSTFYADLVERGFAKVNPVRSVPRSTRRLYKNAHDPRTTPFLERAEDIAAVFRKLDEPHATIFAVGALAGLRPGEVLALEWGDVDLDARRITVRRQVRYGRVGPPKSGRPRFVPIADALGKILAEWRLATGSQGQLFRPAVPTRGGRKGAPPRFVQLHTVHTALATALEKCRLPPALTLYGCTRHTYASHFVLGGGSIEKLQAILGHASVTTTERYAHLRPNYLRPEDLPALGVDLSREGGAVLDMAAHRDGNRGPADHCVTTDAVDEAGSRDVSSGAS
ncbi:MAG TPA: site-specific integrase [Polyangia bacterium]|nr:site-specific integrase [Polyangia bacterium]